MTKHTITATSLVAFHYICSCGMRYRERERAERHVKSSTEESNGN